MAKHSDKQFEAIRIVGGLLGSKVLHDARRYDLPGQTKDDYALEPGLTFGDEIGRYWRIAQARWQEYTQQIERQDIAADKLAQDEWLLPLLKKVLGYQLESSQGFTLEEREFPLSHIANYQTVPLVLCGADVDLDKGAVQFGQEGRKRSPMGLAQEYLNAEDRRLWAIVSNGKYLRLLRDNPAMTRPAYIEVDFARLFDEDNYADFALLWLLLHSSRLQVQDGMVQQCWLEKWRAKGQDEGERALDNLRYGVADALRQLGTGFVAHSENSVLRQKLEQGDLSTDEYFQQVLRLVYRCLFLLTAEDRDIVLYPKHYLNQNGEQQDYTAQRQLYQQGYAIHQLRDRARFNRHYDHHGDAWQQLLITFTGFAQGQPLLAQPALGGLFAEDQCVDLIHCQLENRYLYTALFKLSYFNHQGTLSRINYRDMDTEEFGSVYESLLELIPQLETQGQWRFSFMGDREDEQSASGHSRKLTGSYYTPDSLVQELIKSALEPVIKARLAANPQHPRQALLDITVCDPACGSGHFLLAAARRLASELAQIDAGTDQPTEQDYRHALRDVVRHCIYGVDLNPMAVELCKTGLWLESIEPGKPLSFLDAHIQNGNALVGILDPQLMENGIPSDAYKALTGDNKAVCMELKRQNTAAAKNIAVSMRLIPQDVIKLENMPEDTVEQVAAKQAAYQHSQASGEYYFEQLQQDLFTAAFFAEKTADTVHQVPTNAHLRCLAEGETLDDDVVLLVKRLAQTHKFFHWPLAFPQIFAEHGKGGFDVMLGNPPWERIKLQEKEFFDSRALDIAAAKNAAKRAKLIAALAESELAVERRLFQRFRQAKQGAEGSSAFVRLSQRYPLCGRGDVNLYAVFAEHFSKAINDHGRSGVIVPTGIATDDSTKFFFAWLATGKRLVSLFDFENRDAIFQGVHRSYKFCLLTSGQNIPQAKLTFFATQTSQLADKRRAFRLTSQEFALINPNTLTCPVFRSQYDAEITKKIYRTALVLIKEATKGQEEVNPWGIKFQAMFHMSGDSDVFKTYEDLLSENIDSESVLPLYEAKMVHHYDHRWATYETDGETSRDCTLAEKQDPQYQNRPRYWVPKKQVILRTTDAPKPLLEALKKEDIPAAKAQLIVWLAGFFFDNQQQHQAEVLLGVDPQQDDGGDLFSATPNKAVQAAQHTQASSPLTEPEANTLEQVLENIDVQQNQLWELLEARCPKYLIGWRDITNATNERTVIAGVIPWSGVGDKFLLMFPKVNDSKLIACLLADQISLPHDFIARQKIGGTSFKYFTKKQITNLSPERYHAEHIEFICSRVLELTYTAEILKSWAEDLGYTGEPFDFNPERRHQLKSELDAYYAKLYGLTRDELRYILDPSDVMGEDYPSETFRVLKNKELKAFGEYRTQRLVLEAWDKLERGELT